MTGQGDRSEAGMDALDKMLHAARDAEVPPGLMGRVLEDALAAQPVPQPAPVPVLVRLRDVIGGWQGLGGLALATCAGFWIGVAPPAYLPYAAEVLWAAPEGAAEAGAFGWTLEDLE